MAQLDYSGWRLTRLVSLGSLATIFRKVEALYHLHHVAPEDVEIDDLIPCDRYGAPLFAQLEGDSSLDAMPV